MVGPSGDTAVAVHLDSKIPHDFLSPHLGNYAISCCFIVEMGSRKRYK